MYRPKLKNHTQMRKIYLLTIGLMIALTAFADKRSINEIRQCLEQNSAAAVQEKVYVHMDNTCYFLGDTIWYKAYAVRADDLYFTDMSRILYVELLNPDGLVIERQRIIVSEKGYGDGCFAIGDSLYSGYYELRAYTRWMLNFNVGHKKYTRNDRESFFNNQMARDFFRSWDGLYSRVFPIYEQPETAGDFTYKQMRQRAKQSVEKAAKEKLSAKFYPEGGHLVEGVPCRVAFELTDQEGQGIDIGGTVTAGGTKVADVKATYQGRGVFTVTPGETRMKAKFRWHNWDYEFDLPKAESRGATVTLGDGKAEIVQKGLPMDKQYGVSVMCRGVLKHFAEVAFDGSGRAEVALPQLPTGVNDLTLFDSDGRIIADRLFFVNNHDLDGGLVTIESGAKTTYSPYEKVTLGLKCDGVTEPTNISVAVRDSRTDEPTYDDGDIMTDLLLSSELRGFVANPAYYFEKDDAEHQQRLDLLMMVQGWRKYKWQQLADTAFTPRYQPETGMTIEGGVYKMLSVNEVEPEEIASWAKGTAMISSKKITEDDSETTVEGEEETDDGFKSTDEITTETEPSAQEQTSDIEYGNIADANSDLGVNHGALGKDVLVEAEIVVGGQVAGLTQKTHDGGLFVFQVPAFYGDAVLNMKAYSENDSTKKNLASHQDKHALDEDSYPDYYVKRDLFYPRFATAYSYYQDHAPESQDIIDALAKSNLSMENEDHMLRNVDVKGKKRGRRGIDYNSPAYVADVYDTYNELTDYGLSIGKFDMRLFPIRVCQLLYGNMGRYVRFNVDARINGKVFYRNYQPDTENAGLMWNNFNPNALYSTLKLKRLDKLRVFSDYEPRNEGGIADQSRLRADATVELVPLADDMVQPSMRDRHIIFHGFTEPLDFYSPDYSQQKPSEPTDYRRTLYWNPNAKTDSDGRLNIDFFTGSKETRVKLSAAGITADGHFLRSK